MEFNRGDIAKITDDLSCYWDGDFRSSFSEGEEVRITEIEASYCGNRIRVEKMDGSGYCFLNEDQLQLVSKTDIDFYELGDYLEFIFLGGRWIGEIVEIDRFDTEETYQLRFIYSKQKDLAKYYCDKYWIKNTSIIQRLNFAQVRFSEEGKIYSYLIDKDKDELFKSMFGDFVNAEIYDLQDQFISTSTVQLVDVTHTIDFDFNKLKKIEDFSCLTKQKAEKNDIFNNEGDNTMKNIFGNFYFGPYTKSDIKFSVNGLAYRNSENHFVTLGTDGDITNVDAFTADFDMSSILYIMPVAINQIAIGDIVFHQKAPVYVRNINGNVIEVIDPSTSEIRTIIPEKNMFGFNFVSKLIDITNGLFNTANESNPFGNMLPFMIMGDNCSDMKDMLVPMMMMQNGNFDFGNNDINRMLPLVFLSEGGFNKDMLVPMMMMQNGNFDFGNINPSNEDKDEKTK